jgi:hypothetical protein
MPAQHHGTDLAPEREGVLGPGIGESWRNAAIASDPGTATVYRPGMTVAKESPQQGRLLGRERRHRRSVPPKP